MLRTRIITAAIGIPILLGIAYLGGNYWAGLIALLMAVVLLEYFAMMRCRGFQPIILPAYLMAFILLFRVQLDQNMTGLFWAGLLLMILSMVLRYPRINHSDLALSLFAALYTGFLFSYGLALTELGRSFHILWLVFILTWASDVGGYLFGRLWGKNKMAPQLSPGKTWEGAIGAVLLTIIAALLYTYLIKMESPGVVYIIMLGLLASAAAQLGDLLESSIKRYFGVKDSSRIIPGHGGVMDRFDSFMLVLPVVYYFLVVFV